MQYCVESSIQFFVVGYEKIIDFLEKVKHIEIIEIRKKKNNISNRLIRFLKHALTWQQTKPCVHSKTMLITDTVLKNGV